MITLLITEMQPSLHWSMLTIWQQASVLPCSSVHEVKRKNAVGKKLRQQNALKCHQLSLDTTMLVIKKKKKIQEGEDTACLLTFTFVILLNVSFMRKKTGAAKILNIKRP